MSEHLPDLQSEAQRIAMTVLTINAVAKSPGTVDPDNAPAYTAALRDAALTFGIPDHAYVIAQLLHVLYDLAEFSAGREPETVAQLARAYALKLNGETP